MIETMRIVDNFLDEPMFVRNEVLQAGFYDKEYQGAMYHTIREGMSPEMTIKLAKLFGRDIEVQVAAFRQGKLNSPLHNVIHADNSCSEFASVLYLNKEPIGGTAFWRHKETGWDAMPTTKELEDEGYTLESFGKEWHNLPSWELMSLCGAKFNRVVIYHSQAFHSRWPLNGFGDNDTNARLIHAAFFNLA